MDLISRSQYILTLCQFSGNLILDGHRKSAEELQNESSCRNLCKEIESRLKVCRNSEIPELLDAYDMLHRIGYGKQPDQLLLAKYKSRVYNAWRSGNRDLQESQIFAMLTKDMRSNPGLAVIRNKILERWISTLKKHNRFPEVTTYENYQRLSLLMRENLDRYFEDHGVTSKVTLSDKYDDADEAKWNWYQANRIDEEEFQNLSVELLKTYRRFNTSLFPSVLDYEDQQETDILILEELSTRHDLNPYEREACQMTLHFIKEIVPA